MSLSNFEKLKFIDNPCTAKDPDRYTSITVDIQKAVQSWRLSMYSFEWIDSEGVFRSAAELSDKDRVRRNEVETALQNAHALEKPLLGLGIQDNIEIGSGKAVFLTLASMGLSEMPVHILKSNESDFKAYQP